MAADLMDRTPRLEGVGVEQKAIRRMDCAKRAQRLANRVKAADCDASGCDERMLCPSGSVGRASALLLLLKLAEGDEIKATLCQAKYEPWR